MKFSNLTARLLLAVALATVIAAAEGLLPGASAPPAPAASAAAPPAPATSAAVAASPAGRDGGLVDLSADEVAALREAAALFEPLVADEHESEETRIQALAALDRVHEALNDWGRPGLVDWYLSLIRSTNSSHMIEVFLKSGQSAAKAGQYHLGGVHEFWRRIDEVAAERGQDFQARSDRSRKVFELHTKTLDRSRSLTVSLKPVVVSAKRFNMAGLLKPIAEPKPEPPPKPPAPAKSPSPKRTSSKSGPVGTE
jgi:hypothetical protein